ncbi:MAG: recombinase zinc beta ribbon domain-containing protein [Candidatus Omnitrophica bacterium]|nr:recombinase zinc beta ribbon domain-containing protein [Candidatus Omnitrophota bacterium]
MIRNIIGTFAQFENDVKSERTTNGMRQAIQQGRWCWRAPFGYKQSRDLNNKPLITPAEDSKHVIKAFQLFETGLHRQIEIVQKLRKAGVKKANPNFMNRLLTNPLYAGLIECKWFPGYINAIHEPIITQDTFFKAQQLLTGKKVSLMPRGRNHPDFPLRRFMRCPKCDGKLTGAWSTGRNKKKYAHYHCFTKGCSYNVRKAVLESAFFEYLKSFQPRPDILNLFEKIVIDVWKAQQSEQIKEELRVEKELKALQEKQNRIDKLMIEGTFSEEAYKRNSEDLKNQILMKQIELNEVKIDLNDVEACLNYCKFFVSNLAQLWASSEVDLRQRFQSLVFPDKIYYEKGTFRTTGTALIFKQLAAKSPEELNLVAPTGFEPVFDG